MLLLCTSATLAPDIEVRPNFEQVDQQTPGQLEAYGWEHACAGLQMTIDDIQQDNPVKAVEDVVAFAIMKAGFMRKENFGFPTKVSWTRSSRTDKGVHSVATVVSLKMHCNDESWLSDPEGLQYAEAINRYHPPLQTRQRWRPISSWSVIELHCVVCFGTELYFLFLNCIVLFTDSEFNDTLFVTICTLDTASKDT